MREVGMAIIVGLAACGGSSPNAVQPASPLAAREVEAESEPVIRDKSNVHLPPKTIQKIIRGNFGALRACYEAGLKRNAALLGRVTMRFTIERNGRTSGVTAGGTLDDEQAVACVLDVFRRLVFPEPQNGKFTVGYPVMFRPLKAHLSTRMVRSSENGKVGNASSVVASMRGRFLSCYEGGRRTNPQTAGSVWLMAKIGPAGEVMGVRHRGEHGLTAILPCLKDVVRSGAFSPPRGGSAVLSIPITIVRH